MIEIPTVLVLGAGASVHVGYPLGGELVNALCRRRGSISTGDLPMGWTAEDADRFLTRLSRAGHYSIDAFLETVPDQADLGKYLMASVLKRSENEDLLFPPQDPGWYRYLFNQILENDSASGFASSRLSIITFNYDRSLEAYLHAALMARFNMPSDEASSTLSQIPIVHVHGSLGSFPSIPYASKCGTDELLEISRQIQIIHDVSDQKEGFCNREFEQANALLKESQRVFFLGFGFHRDNIRRFQFFSPDQTADREIKAAVASLGAVELADIALRMKPFGIERAVLSLNRCNNFFSHVAGLR